MLESFYFISNWNDFLEDCFGWEIKHLDMKNKTAIPYIIKYGLNFKKIVSSLPFAHSLPEVPIDDMNFIKEVLKKNNATFFNYHGILLNPQVQKYSINSIVKINLSQFENSDTIFSNFSKNSIQRKINKAYQKGFRVELLDTVDDYIQFQKIQSDTRKRQGAPTYPKDYFKKLFYHFKNTNYIKLFGIYNHRQLAAGIIIYAYNQSATYAYGACQSNDELLKLGINQLCLWESIKHAKENKCDWYDLGSTPKHHVSLLEYKLKWASEKEDLYYSYYGTKHSSKFIFNRKSKPAIYIGNLLKIMPSPVFENVSPYLLKFAVH